MSPHRRTSRAVAASATRVVAVAASVLAVALVAITAAPSVAAPVRPSASPTSVLVTVSDLLKFTPDQISATPGVTVSLVVQQLGTTGHTFTLSSVTVAAGGSLGANTTPAQVYAFVRAHPPTLNLSIPATMGAKVRATFVAPPAGVYEYFCTVPSHVQSGMHGLLYSGVAPPSPSSANNTASMGEFVISGAILVLVVIGIALGFVVGRRRGSVHEMPPERLGYPETPPAAPPAEPPPAEPWRRRP
jgi:plastocyanin